MEADFQAAQKRKELEVRRGLGSAPLSRDREGLLRGDGVCCRMAG